jgi:hypothetical protein
MGLCGCVVPHARHGPDQRLVDVLNRLDEVRLAQDEVGVIGLLNLHGDELHVAPLMPASLTPVSGP